MTHYRKTMAQVLAEVSQVEANLEERLLDENDAALKKKAEKSGMPLGILKQVFRRGVAAWKGGHRPGTNPQQWGLARVNSFVTKSSGTWGKADADLAAKVRGEEYVPEQDEPASPDESSMAVQQLEFMMHAVTRMKDHIASGGEFPEWMQNKLASTHEKLKSLYANIDHEEAVSPAQQAAIAISKKERGEKPKKKENQ